MRRRLTLCLFSLLAVLPHACAEPARFVVRVWQSDAGLPGNAVRSVAQAADGYLWVATAEGVVRFDGVRFSGFDHPEESALSALPARGIFPLPDGQVWVGLDRGALLRWQGGKLTRVLEESATPGAVVTQVVPVGPAIVVIRGAEIWRVPATGPAALQPPDPTVDAALVLDAETAIARGRAPASGGLPQLTDRTGRRWQVEAAGGLTVTEPDGAASRVPLADPAYRISELAEDRDGSLWAATADNGLAQIRAARVRMMGVEEGLSDRVITPILEARDGTMWLGNKGGQVDRIAPDGVQHFTLGDGSRAVAALMEDAQGNIWAATRHGSVFRREDGAFHPAFGPQSPAAQTQAMAADRAGRLWFGGLRGLCVQESGELKTISLGNESEEITSVAVDGSDAVWIGTRTGRLWRGHHGTWKQLPFTPGRMITGFFPTPSGLWMSTLGAGLWRITGDKPLQLSTAQGLPDPRLTAVMEDQNGHLWLGSLAGIFRASGPELSRWLSGKGAPPRWLRLDRSDGLSVRECSGFSQPSSWRSRDGRLWFPTVNGVAILQPATFPVHSRPPVTRLEAVDINGAAQPLTSGPIVTGPGSVGLDARYTAFSFAAPEKLRFFHRLEGLETQWRETSERTVSYPAVPPGRYTFRVRAENGDGVPEGTGIAQAIMVRPYFWQTAWFRAVAIASGAVLAAGVGLAIARARWRRKMARLEIQHAREAERARIARDLHDELGASLTEISMLANVTAEEEASPSVRSSLEEIATKAQTIVGELDEIVWAVNPRHDTLSSLVDYLAAFAGEFLSTAQITLRLDLPRDLPTIPVETERRHALLLAVREALNNVVKHAKASEVRLRVQLPPGAIEIEVADQGRGFVAEQASSGEGLRNLRERMQSLGGETQIVSQPGHGTTVTLRLPLLPPA